MGTVRKSIPPVGANGSAKKTGRIPLRHAIAAGLMFVLVGGGYVTYRGWNQSAQPLPQLPSADGTTEWIQVPVLREMSVGEPFSGWQNHMRSPFEKIQGWKGPIREFDRESLTFGYTVAQPSPAIESDPNATTENAQCDARSVRIPAGEKQPEVESILKNVNGVDNSAATVLSKGFKD